MGESPQRERKQRERKQRGCPRHASPILGVKDIPMTIFGATFADIFLGIVTIIVAEFLAFFDIPRSDNPDGAPGDFRFTVRIAGMIDVARLILQRLPIDIIAVN